MVFYLFVLPFPYFFPPEEGARGARKKHFEENHFGALPGRVRERKRVEGEEKFRNENILFSYLDPS